MIHVVLFEPENAGNVGNIARTCSVVGAELHLIRPFGFHLHDTQFRRAGMDYLEGVVLRDHADWAAFRSSLPGGARLWGFTARTSRAFWDVAFSRGDYLVFGPESRGLPEWVRAQLEGVTIPMPAGGRSLNLAVSVGIGVYEAVRQLERG